MGAYIAVLDYGVGNLKSVTKALAFVGCKSVVTDSERELERAGGILLPGVGAFPNAARILRERGLDRLLAAEAKRKPLLGICLGMQLLFDFSGEISRSAGLGLIPGRVVRIDTRLKLPQIGWNEIRVLNKNPLTEGLDGEYVYFVHSFHALPEHPSDLACVTDYGGQVTAMAARGNVFGCQFHPEKSGDAGLRILKNFGELLK